MMRCLLALTCVLGLGPVLLHGDDWPQWRGPRRDGVWRERGIVKRLPDKLHVVWRSEIGAGYAGPAVADGRVYVTDRVLEKGTANPADPFSRQAVKGFERVHCLDALRGTRVWTHRYPCRYSISYPSGPRATPTVHAGKVYTVGAMGDLICLDAKTGRVLWSRDYVEDYGADISTWGIAAAPLVDGDRLICITGGSQNRCVVALDRNTGREIWHALAADNPGYAPPMLYEAGGVRQLIVWTPTHLRSLDPGTGRVFWAERFGVKHGLTVATPIFDPTSHRLFVGAFYDGPLMMQLGREKPEARVLWRGTSGSERKTDKLHSLMCTPVDDDGHLYGVCSYGQLRCLKADTGERVWETFEATGEGRWWNAFIVPHEDRAFIHNEQGDLIIARLSPKGYEEISRSFLIAPTNRAQKRDLVWSHPAFANRGVYARNDKEILFVSLATEAE